MVKDRSILILYTDAICQLNCRYCFIDKNPALLSIDKILEQSFAEPNYYFNFAKEVFPNPQQLKEIQFWGGEPSLHLDRVIPTITSLIEYYPNLEKFVMSTNLAADCFIEQFFKFLNVLKKYPKRHFIFSLQLSIDGPKYINDLNRGKGTTELFSNNFYNLLKDLKSFLINGQNIDVEMYPKATLDISSINQLQTKQAIIDYYKFFEKYQDLYNCFYPREEKIHFNINIPNTACPSPHTKEDGLKFANLCKLCKEIEKENEINPIFKYYKNITPFEEGLGDYKEHPKKEITIFNCGNCGSCKFCFGLLPNKFISICHNGFTEIASEYKQYCSENLNNHTIDFNLFISNNKNHNFIFPFKDLEKYEAQIEPFYLRNSHFQILTLVSQIMFLAKNHQIEEKYMNYDLALDAANFLRTHTAYCMRDNFGVNGSKFIEPPGLTKLLLNGAKDYIEQNERLSN